MDMMDGLPQWPGAIAISAKTGEGIETLLEAIKKKLRGIQRKLRVTIPYAQGALLSMLHNTGSVIHEEYTDTGMVVDAMGDDELYGRLAAKLGEKALLWLE